LGKRDKKGHKHWRNRRIKKGERNLYHYSLRAAIFTVAWVFFDGGGAKKRNITSKRGKKDSRRSSFTIGGDPASRKSPRVQAKRKISAGNGAGEGREKGLTL